MTRRARSRAAGLLVITFVAGGAAGFAASRSILPESGAVDAASGPGSHVPGPSSGGSTIERFADELELTDAQRAEIAPIVEETRARMSALFDRVRPEYGDIVDSARVRIESLLTPAQTARYRQLLEERYGTEPGVLGPHDTDAAENHEAGETRVVE